MPRVVILVLYWIALAVATHYPRVSIPTGLQYRDKIVHLAAYGLLAGLSWFALPMRTNRSVWLVGCVLLIYAALDEYTQQFFGRGTDPLDWISDALGVSIVLGICELRRRRAAAG